MDNNFNIQDLVRRNVKNLKPYSSARDEYVDFKKDMIFLDANENPFQNGINRYPDPKQRDLKSILAEQRQIPEDQLLLGNGSDEVLDLIFRAFCEPNTDTIITLPPTYGMYKVLAATNAIANKEVLLTEDFQPNVEEILNKADANTKLIFLCSPNNPTGNLFDASLVEQLLKGFHGLVVIDEAYIDFAQCDSWIGRLQDFPNLVVTQTLSKAYGMAGIRLGICLASKEIIAILNRIKPPYNVNELTQQRAIMEIGLNKVGKQVSTLLEERDKLLLRLVDIPFIKKVFHTDANFVLVQVDDANNRYQELLKKGVVIRNRSTQPQCENTLRFTVGTREENKKLMEILKEMASL